MKVVGFISDGDIMKYIGRSEGAVLDATLMLYRATDNENFMQRVSELLDLNVMRIATKGAISVESGSELDEACRLLAEKRIKKAPVVSEDGTTRRLAFPLRRYSIHHGKPRCNRSSCQKIETRKRLTTRTLLFSRPASNFGLMRGRFAFRAMLQGLKRA